MANNNFQIRNMQPDELEFALRWAEREGWNPGLDDARCFYAADPGGFFIGLLDGRPVACVSAVRYGADFGFMGFYIVEPEYRSRGYGGQLAEAGLRHLAGCCIGLDGVVEQQDNYRKSGFDWAYRNIRYRGVSSPGDAAAGEGLVPLSQVSFAELAAYDRELFPAPRDAFLQAWIEQPDATALGSRRGDRLQGYGVIRRCSDGYKIGPLFADTPALAEQLLRGLTAAVPAGSHFYLDIPEPNAEARALIQRHGMAKVFETARMYMGKAPQLPLERLYGVTTFELG